MDIIYDDENEPEEDEIIVPCPFCEIQNTPSDSCGHVIGEGSAGMISWYEPFEVFEQIIDAGFDARKLVSGGEYFGNFDGDDFLDYLVFLPDFDVAGYAVEGGPGLSSSYVFYYVSDREFGDELAAIKFRADAYFAKQAQLKKDREERVKETVAKTNWASKTDAQIKNAKLFESIIKGDIAAVQSCLEPSGPINGADKRGYSPLMVAIEHGHLEIVSYLITKGAKLYLKSWPDPEGNTISAMELAFCSRHPQLLELMNR